MATLSREQKEGPATQAGTPAAAAVTTVATTTTAAAATALATPRDRILPYLLIARPDHWFKNIFMVPGILLVLFFDVEFLSWMSTLKIGIGFLSACLVSSSNYVLNEILDARWDGFHPEKARRPIPSGRITISIAYAEWLLLAAAGLGLGAWVGTRFAVAASLLWLMGILYNTPPIRFKDLPYADVLSESLNNPLRMAMGWYATGYGSAPTLSVVMAYWMFGAFLMAIKRFAEYRTIGDRERAARYRRSFAHYNQERLLASIVFYASLFALFSGVFIARYRVELVLAAPLVCVTMAWYFHLGFAANSPVQRPEHLYRVMPLVALTGGTALVCAILLFVDVPLVSQMFREWYAWNR